MGFILAKQGSRGKQTSGDEQKFPKERRFCTLSGQRQVQTLTERRDAYNMQVSQDWKTFRWSRITLLSDTAGKLIRMKVHVFSDSTLCVGVSNPAPSNNWTTQVEEVWNEHGFDHRDSIRLARTARC